MGERGHFGALLFTIMCIGLYDPSSGHVYIELLVCLESSVILECTVVM